MSKNRLHQEIFEMLSAKNGIEALSGRKELSKININEEIIFSWLDENRKGSGLKKARKYNSKAVCGSGTGRTAEPDAETIITRNKLGNVPFFYLRGG